jgi:hypothetical protein
MKEKTISIKFTNTELRILADSLISHRYNVLTWTSQEEITRMKELEKKARACELKLITQIR